MEVGIDIVQNRRVKLQPKFLRHVLSVEELKQLDQLPDKRNKREFVAGRWAVKEAIIKTLVSPIPMNQLIVLNLPDGKPYLQSERLITDTIKISLSHERHYSVGVAINESDF